MYKHCFLPLLLVLVMKCCGKMCCFRPHNACCCFSVLASFFKPSVHLRAWLNTCSSVDASTLHPMLAHHHVSCWCQSCFCLFCYFVFFSLLSELNQSLPVLHCSSWKWRQVHARDVLRTLPQPSTQNQQTTS